MSKEQIIGRVRELLRANPPKGFSIEVVEGSAREDGGWWYIPVRTGENEPRTYEYYTVLTDIEEHLRRNENLDVLLVPAG